MSAMLGNPPSNAIFWPFSNTAYEHMYARYFTMVLRRTMNLLSDAPQAESAANETFARFITYSQNHPVPNVAAHLYQVATRVVLERLRAPKSHGHTGVAEIFGHNRWALEEQLPLAEVLVLVDMDTAQVATLYYLDVMPVAEISQVMHLPVRSVSGHIQRFGERAWQMLRERDAQASEPPLGSTP